MNFEKHYENGLYQVKRNFNGRVESCINRDLPTYNTKSVSIDEIVYVYFHGRDDKIVTFREYAVLTNKYILFVNEYIFSALIYLDGT